MSLTRDRNTPFRANEEYGRPVAANAVIYQGALVALNAAGFAVPGAEATGLKADGRAETHVNNDGGANGDHHVIVRKGVFAWDQAGTAITRVNIGATAYIEDDHTVTLATAGRSAAGEIVDVDDNGVWVRTE